MSGFEFFFVHLNNFSLYYIDSVNYFALFREQNISVWDYVFQLDGS